MSNRIDLRLQPIGGRGWLTTCLRACNTVTQLTVDQGQLHAQFGTGRSAPVSIAAESRVGRRLTLLKIRTADARSQPHTVVLADFGPYLRNVTPEGFRRLRMWLRLGRASRNLASTT
ncbi:hypothetical protein [Marinobacter sp.]|uniref:hypothetical protein n=1 Tax=Marinobacter sp. TaxID=50741 RepID=UPI0034A53A6E